MNRLSYWLPGAALLAAVIAALLYWWPRAPRPQLPPSDIPAAAVAPAAPPPAVAASEPAIKYPIEAASAAPLPKADDFSAALVELLGAKAVQAFVQTDDFAQRFVTTVDNLGRPFAASRLWPVNPAPGRFTVAGQGATRTIDARNAERYDAFVGFVDGVDAARAVATYKKLYPKLQRAYEEQGFPGRYLNDRVVEVIDQLLATPEPTGPLEVRLTQVKGPLASTRPWVRYEYVRPEYESLASGQKMLLRMGPAHERRLKAKLRELRQRLAGG